jgi:hypothetical protein
MQPSYFLWGRYDPVLKFAWSDRLGTMLTTYRWNALRTPVISFLSSGPI